MIKHIDIQPNTLRSKIKWKEITLAGNLRLKVFGKLNCKTGARMKKNNRVFFKDKNEALEYGFHPCGNCCRQEYVDRKHQQVSG